MAKVHNSLVWAVSRGTLADVKGVLTAEDTILGSDHLRRAFIKSCYAGRLEASQLLFDYLDRDGTVEQHVLQMALTHACTRGNAALVLWLLSLEGATRAQISW